MHLFSHVFNTLANCFHLQMVDGNCGVLWASECICIRHRYHRELYLSFGFVEGTFWKHVDSTITWLHLCSQHTQPNYWINNICMHHPLILPSRVIEKLLTMNASLTQLTLTKLATRVRSSDNIRVYTHIQHKSSMHNWACNKTHEHEISVRSTSWKLINFREHSNVSKPSAFLKHS